MSFPVERNIVLSTRNDIFFSCKIPFVGVFYFRAEKNPECRKKRRKYAMLTQVRLFPYFQAFILRKAISYFYGKGDMEKVLMLSSKMDAMQIAYWEKREYKAEA